MTKFNLVVELEDDKKCDGCIALAWDDHFGCWDCNSAGEKLAYGLRAETKRPAWCPLIPRTEVKLEPTPLTPEELAEYQKDLENP